MKNYYPLSQIQDQIYFSQKLHPHSPMFNIGGYMDFSGKVAAVHFKKCIEVLLEKNNALSAVFEEQDGTPCQYWAAADQVDAAAIDFTQEPNPEAAALSWMNNDMATAFSFSGLLIKCRLLNISENKCYWYIKFHHIIGDGWSFLLLFRNLSEIFKSISSDSPFTQHPAAYELFIEDEKNYLQSAQFTEDEKFWAAAYEGFETTPAFAAADNPLKSPTLKSIRKKIVIPQQQYNDILDFTNKHHVTVAHFFLGVLYVYLSRITGSNDLTLGFPILNRSSKTFKQTMGAFVNMISLRFRYQQDLSFTRLTQEIKELLRTAYRHQRYPLKLLTRQVIRQRSGDSRLFPLIFSYEKYNYGHVFADTAVTVHQLSNGDEENELAIHVFEFSENEGLTIEIDFRLDLFAERNMNSWLLHLENLITAALGNAALPISTLSFIGKEEAEQLTSGFNDTQVPHPDETIVSLFEKQVKATPHAVAIRARGHVFIYHDIDEKSNQLARYLTARYPFVPGNPVAIMLERTEWIVIAMLGIMKAGGAYVPVDPAYPAERITHILKDCQSRLLITDNNHYNNGTESLNIKENQEQIATFAGTAVEKPPSPTDPAYVIYTSGSTGMPKGIMIAHRNTANLLNWGKSVYSKDVLQGVLAATSVCFDLSVFEIFLPLVCGGTVILADTILDLAQVTLHNEITLINTVPSAIKALLRSNNIPPTVRVINLAGEVLSPLLVKEIYQQTAVEQVYNLYGPSETTTYSTFTLISKGKEEKLTIGKPIHNTSIYILDKNQSLLPAGSAGELYIGGAGVALGYLNRPELTAGKFITSPFKTGEILYKTEDWGRWQDDGNIVFLGRVDEQVKVRGFRVELKEIANRLLHFDQIKDAVVLAREDQDGILSLAAYFVSPVTVNTAALVDYLQQWLPEYMIPSYFIPLPAFPLTPNGKTDKKALPLPEGRVAAGSYEPPANEVEARLVAIWSAVLEINQVGVTDNFFDLGGHSLKATHTLFRVSKSFNVTIGFLEMVNNPTIRALAQLISKQALNTGNTIPLVETADYYDVSHGQQRLWLFNQLGEPAGAYHMTGQYLLEGDLNTEAFEKAYQALISRHEILRTIFVEVNGNVKQQVRQPQDNISRVELIDLRNCPATAITDRISRESSAAFNLAAGPLLYCKLFYLDNKRYIVQLTMHHIISDGWSVKVFMDEISLLYKAFSHHEPSPLLPLTIQYKDFAAWQNNRLLDGSLQLHEKYWLEQLSGTLPVLNIPTDLHRPATKSYTGNLRSFSLGEKLSCGLKDFSKEQGAGIFTVLFAGINLLLHKLTGQNDIITGVPVTGRQHYQLAEQMGFYVNTLALRTQLTETDSFIACFHQIKTLTLNSYAHQDYPFDKLIDTLEPPRLPGREPLLDVLVSLLESDTAISLGEGIHITEYKSAHTVSKFDCSFLFFDAGTDIRCDIEYDSRLFYEETILLWFEKLKLLLQQSIATPHKTLKEFNVQTNAESALMDESMDINAAFNF